MRDTIDMAREAGYGEHLSMLHAVALNRFAELVRADEREACAKVCEEVLEQYRGTNMGKHAELVGDACANAIRARGNT
jgi:hypothetical protein